jgi:predicted DNA-binding transcriptional regulator AlpA
VARLMQATPPAGSLRIRQACQMLQMSEAQLWAEVKAGRYTVYRVRQNNHWELRITI